MARICANCRKEIEDGQEWYKYLDNFLQVKYFDDEETENVFCCQECAGKALMLTVNGLFE